MAVTWRASSGDSRRHQSNDASFLHRVRGVDSLQDLFPDQKTAFIPSQPAPLRLKKEEPHSATPFFLAPPLFSSTFREIIAQRYMNAFFDKEFDFFWKQLSKNMRDEISTPKELEFFYVALFARYGEETGVKSEDFKNEGDYFSLTRRMSWSKIASSLRLELIIDASGMIVGISFGFHNPFKDYQTRSKLRLPFQGTWRVLHGGRDENGNHHKKSISQYYAYDFVMTQNGSTHRGNGDQNEDYYAFGQPILAPAAGVVISSRDGIPDNRPGEKYMNRHLDEIRGNYVVIDHQNGEYSFLVHLQQGSVQVKAGDRVRPGDPIGRCGNSGHSSEPHLHYHLQNRSRFNFGDGLPAQFQNYKVKGDIIERGEPSRGTVIAF